MAHEYELSSKVAEEVRAMLARRRHSVRDLAEAAGISEATAYRRMSGESSWEIDEIGRVADWLGVPVATLLGPAAA